MDTNPRLQKMASKFSKSPRLLQLAVIAGWLAGESSAERAHRSRWNAEDMNAAIAAALAFLELNQPRNKRKILKLVPRQLCPKVYILLKHHRPRALVFGYCASVGSVRARSGNSEPPTV